MDQYLAIYIPVVELAKRIDIANKSRITLNPTIELNFFKQMLRDLDIPAGEINNLTLEGTVGDYRLALNGQAVDIIRGVEDLRYNANLINFLQRIGLTSTATAQAKEVEIKAQYMQNAHGLHQLMRMKNRIIIANDITGRYGKSPRNEQELEAILEKDPNLKATFEAFLQKLRGSYTTDPNAKPYGDWVRKPYRGRRYDLSALFRIIDYHKVSLGGCWAVRADGYKCILPSLSCSPFKSQRPFRCDDDNRCGPDKQQPCYRCIKWNDDNTCAEVPPCDRGKKSCSKACSNREIEVPSDTVLLCIKRKFWISAQDYMNEEFTLTPGPPVPVQDKDKDTDDDDDDAADQDQEQDPEDYEPTELRQVGQFFRSTWIIWVIGFVIIAIVLYRG